MTHLSTSPDYARIKRVKSFQELVATPFANGVNALCWKRTLLGDFGEIVEQLGGTEEITILDEAHLRSLPVSAAGRNAIEILIEDQRLLREHHLDPVLNCIRNYPRDESSAVVPTDVYSFHVDSATVPADTYLCTYYGAPSEGLPNEQARRRVDVPETRDALLKQFGGPDNDDFRTYLKENCFDLHYEPTPTAEPYSFGIGNLWRIAVNHPGSPVPPCIHRAPPNMPGDQPRLLLIS